MQSIECDDVMRQAQFGQKLLRRRHLMGFFTDLEMREQQIGPCIEGMQHLRCFAVVEVIEAAFEGLAVKRNDTLPGAAGGGLQAGSMLAEHLFNRGRIKALQNVANGGVGRRTFPVQAEGRVQAGAVDTDESDDATERICPGHHGQDRKY